MSPDMRHITALKGKYDKAEFTVGQSLLHTD